MNIQDIKEIANYIRKKVRQLVPYSSNRPSIHEQPFHRLFWLRAMRARNDKHGDRKRLNSWHMNVSNEKVNDAYPFRRVTQTFFGSTVPEPSLKMWNNYITSLPKRNNKKKRKNGEVVTQLELYESYTKNAINFGIGNCGEMSVTALNLLLDYPDEGLDGLPKVTEEIGMEIADIVGKGDHAFLIIGRDPESNIKDLSTWGPHAIILDPWMNDVFLVADELKNPTSHCFQYIQHHQSSLETEMEKNNPYYIGAGHSDHWLEKCIESERPLNFFDWKPAVNDGSNVPWAKDYDKDCHQAKRANK